jgi:hypothetical protein
MKHIHVVLEDKEAKRLERIKGDRSWKDLLLSVEMLEALYPTERKQ